MNNILSFILDSEAIQMEEDNSNYLLCYSCINDVLRVFTALAGVALPFLIFGFSDLICTRESDTFKKCFVGLSLALLVFIFSRCGWSI